MRVLNATPSCFFEHKIQQFACKAILGSQFIIFNYFRPNFWGELDFHVFYSLAKNHASTIYLSWSKVAETPILTLNRP